MSFTVYDPDKILADEVETYAPLEFPILTTGSVVHSFDIVFVLTGVAHQFTFVVVGIAIRPTHLLDNRFTRRRTPALGVAILIYTTLLTKCARLNITWIIA